MDQEHFGEDERKQNLITIEVVKYSVSKWSGRVERPRGGPGEQGGGVEKGVTGNCDT